MKSIAQSLILLTLSSAAAADLPHTFTANTKAKASEVNENFEYLLDQIEDLKNASNNGNTITCSETESPYPYTYNRVVAPLGTTLTLGSTEYKLTKYATVDPETGNTYHITLPVPAINQSTPAPLTYVIFSPIFNTFDPNFACNGPGAFGTQFVFSKSNYLKTSSLFIYANDGNDDSNTYSDTAVIKSLSYYAQIAVGTRYILISYFLTGKSKEKLVSSGDYDFTDDLIEFNPDFSQEAAELTNLLNHIYVEKVQP